MDPLPVTLIVKAPNQQFEDQTIKCEPTWSIRRVKLRLSEVYPCNPSLEEQKLIYSGQLLNDSHILKDVLRQYEGQEAHTVHLVYTPKNRQQQLQTTKASQSTRKNTNQQPQKSPSSSTTTSTTQQSQATLANTDGLRHRNVTNASQSTPIGTQPVPGFSVNPQQFVSGAWMQPDPSTLNPAQQYMMAQQMAMQNMMHQMYIQYMNQYANSFQNTNLTGSNQMPPQYPMMNYFPNAWNPSANPAIDLQARPQQPQQVDQAPVVAQAPRFQANDEEENRDWLEILYTLSRLLVLSSLVYFYSSPGRCSIVIIVALLYYLYQNHQRNLRERQQHEQGQGQNERDGDAEVIEAPVQNNNNDPQGENNAIPENNQANGDLTTPLAASNETTQGTLSGGEQDENNRLPTVALLRTFILSFFSSLIPETPAV